MTKCDEGVRRDGEVKASVTIELKRIHHVAYRCMDAKETVDFYQRVLNMGFVLAISPKTRSPSTKEPGPHARLLRRGYGQRVGLLRLPNLLEPMGRDEMTPTVQHIMARPRTSTH